MLEIQEILKRFASQIGERCKEELQERTLTAWPPLAWPLSTPRAIPQTLFLLFQNNNFQPRFEKIFQLLVF